MESSLQAGALRGAYLARNWLAVGLALSLVATVILALSIAGRQPEIVLIPAQSSAQEYRFTGGVASKEYLADLAVTAALFLLNQTPGTSEAARQRFLRLLHPASFAKFSSLWDRTTEELRQRDISTAFYPLVVRVESQTATVELEGQFVTFLGQSRTEEHRTYVVRFSTEGGPLLLTAFDEKAEVNG